MNRISARKIPTMNTFTYLFLFMLGTGLALEYWLLWRQARSVSGHRAHVPEAFADSISLPDHQKAADYTIANISLERISLAVSAVILLAWTLGGGLELLAGLWDASGLSSLWKGVGLIFSLLFLGTILELPLGLWKTFGIEAKFGFNKITGKQYVIDLSLQLLLTLIIGLPLITIVLWLMEQIGSYWWIAVWVVWTAFTLIITWAYPTFIAPLFNKFQPLENETLKARLEKLLDRCGFSSDGMFVMDGSKRSAHGNAYFTGLGKNKRIVFFDTLLAGLEEEEIEAVLAHELGHFRHKHIRKMMIIMSLMSFAGLALLGWLIGQNWFYAGLGVSHQSAAMALVLFILVIPVFTSFLTPLFSAMSRKHEFQADEYAARQSDANALISGLVRMYKENASTLTPDPVYSAFHHSHPPAPVRIAHLSSKIE